jgi:hypothetical protein
VPRLDVATVPVGPCKGLVEGEVRVVKAAEDPSKGEWRVCGMPTSPVLCLIPWEKVFSRWSRSTRAVSTQFGAAWISVKPSSRTRYCFVRRSSKLLTILGGSGWSQIVHLDKADPETIQIGEGVERYAYFNHALLRDAVVVIAALGRPCAALHRTGLGTARRGLRHHRSL